MVNNYFSFQQKEREPIGGWNQVVHIDETKFGKRKYKRGRMIEGNWVLGIILHGMDEV